MEIWKKGGYSPVSKRESRAEVGKEAKKPNHVSTLQAMVKKFGF